jgi:methylenetetrahydrofolate reductase (NADPH)
LGVRNVLCITGDGVHVGDQPDAKPVFDMDSIQLIQTANTMRTQSIFLSNRKIDAPPKLFIGGAANPFVPPYEGRVARLAKKIAAGADFIQTQYCFDVDRFRTFMHKVIDLGLHEKVFILVGVGPLRSARAGLWMRENVPGVSIPDNIITRLEKVPKGQQSEEGIQVGVEIIEQVRQIEGVSGIHVMAYRQEDRVAEMIQRSGLLPRHRIRSNE